MPAWQIIVLTRQKAAAAENTGTQDRGHTQLSLTPCFIVYTFFHKDWEEKTVKLNLTFCVNLLIYD